MFPDNDLGPEDFKSSPDVFQPLGTGKLGLGFSEAGAKERSGIQGDRVRPADAPGQKRRLIKPPLAEAAAMERNGEDKIKLGKGKIRVLIFGKKKAQGFG